MNFSIHQTVSFILFAICFGSFAWGMQRLFVVTKPTPRLVVLTKLLGTGFALASAYILLTTTTHLSTIYAGWALHLAGTLVFWLTFKSAKSTKFAFAFIEAPQDLILQNGTFRWVRHPFYSSYLLGWIGSVLIADHVLLKIALVCMGLLYWKAASEEESRFLQSALASDYDAYRRTVGKFFPRLF